MTTMRLFKNVLEEGAIIIFFVILLVTFALLGFFVVEKNVTDLLGVYETPSIVYFTQSIETNDQTVEASVTEAEQVTDEENKEQEQHRGLNQLAKVLEKNVESKAHGFILWCMDKISQGLEYVADQIAKILQSS